ncbi:MAG: DUF1684 domain-containing protein [Chitinophagaceae bacterium]
MKQSYAAVAIIFLWAGAFLPATISAQSYKDQLNQWYQQRAEQLKAADGWLNLAGLFWLEEGRNNFGSGDTLKIKFPAGTIPPYAGFFELRGNQVTQYAAPGVKILINQKETSTALVFNNEINAAPLSAFGSLRWVIIKRGNKIGIRLRNLESAAVKNFKGIDHYPVDDKLVVRAHLEGSTLPGSIAITNVLGQVNEQSSPGKLHFTVAGTAYTLDALEENNQLFIIFADATSGETTYPSGRFLLAEKPGAGGFTTIDFNRAYNPPCAFTEFATCPLPPRQNILPFAVTAGEKNFGLHEKK